LINNYNILRAINPGSSYERLKQSEIENDFNVIEADNII